MNIQLVKFEPSSQRGEFSLQVPAGARPILARMTRMGDAEIVLACPDAITGEAEPMRFLALWEDSTRQGGGDPANWRHIGSWNFTSGSWQHVWCADVRKKNPPSA